MSFYKFMKIGFGWLMRLLFGVSITPSNHIESEQGVIICSNHTSMMDPVLIMATVDREVHYMAKKEIFKIPLLSLFFKAMKVFPVNRGGADIGAIKKTEEILKCGECVGIFPQGTRRKNVNPANTEVKHGVGLIAYRSGCDILPVFLKTKNNHVRLFGKCEIIMGDIIKNEELGFEKGGVSEYKRATERIFTEICSLGGYERENRLGEGEK